jgi:uncharacterized protein (DUF1015 family)
MYDGRMAEIAGFRGIVYDTSRVDGSLVLAPPYDVIDHAGREALAARDPHNCVRLILPEGDEATRYETAARTFSSWVEQGVLRRDRAPAIYRYNQVFTSAELGGREITRRGFIAAVRLHAFDEGVILPHERTLKGPKLDRLRLMRATRAQLSQVFGLYRDPEHRLDEALAAAERDPPYLDGTTDEGTRHLMWRVTDPEVLAKVAKMLANQPIYLADGHHRYETLLALRDELAAGRGGQLDPRSAARFGAIFLANLDDPGLVVLPTHRLVHSLTSFDAGALLSRARAHFEVSTIAGAATDADAIRRALASSGETRPTLAAVFPGEDDVALLALRGDFDPFAAGLAGPRALTGLDVTLLHELVLERILGVDRAAQEAQLNLTYVKDTGEALAKVRAGEAQVGLLMNATPVDQIRAVADAGEVMPQKSTFFYPKIASGIVMHALDPDELLP